MESFGKVRMDLAYDGTDFFGWAKQPGLRTVQGTVEQGLETILRLPTGALALTVAGRTDTGVHARGQVCSLTLPVGGADLDLPRLLARLNRLLPDDVAVRRLTPAPAAFDARFSAVWRRYAYRLTDRPADRDPLRRRDTVAWPRPTDVDAMHAAAESLLGEHDFAAFCKRREGASTVRRLRELRVQREAGGVTCHVVADAFCHHMVRSIVGCLLVVGEGRRPPTWAAEVLAAKVRDSAVPVAPAHGLTLEEVRYPRDEELAERNLQTRGLRRARTTT